MAGKPNESTSLRVEATPPPGKAAAGSLCLERNSRCRDKRHPEDSRPRRTMENEFHFFVFPAHSRISTLICSEHVNGREVRFFFEHFIS